jgi:hypothetical protein
MKPLAEYDWNDWRRLRPITHRLKTLRYNARREAYVRRPLRAGDTRLRERIHGRQILVTVAFNDFEAIEMQACLVARFVPHAQYLIADNSTSDKTAAEIGAFAAARGIPYLRLPRNPWAREDKQASRAHGLALNWVWRNVLLPCEPSMFGLLDDDIFPTKPDDPFAILERQPVYGYCRQVGPRWFLGGAFAVYRFDYVKHLPLDFGQDWFNGLDTGGANWDALFGKLDRSRLEFMPTRFEPYKADADPVQASIQWCGDWLHEVGQTRRGNLLDVAVDKRRVIKELLAPHLATCATVVSHDP